MRNKSAGLQEFSFVILVPGMDTQKLLNEYQNALFAKGFYGAFSFPPSAPLAELSQPFNRDELKELAGGIRKLSMAHDGKISSNESGVDIIEGFGEYSFFGLRLDFPADLPVIEELLSETAKNKIVRVFFPPVLCASLVHSGENYLPKEWPTLSFRAAALANLAIRPLPGRTSGEAPAFSFEWKMGEPVWLPAYKKANAKK
jgi:hypothetical protein